MTWKVEFNASARKALRKLNPGVQSEILRYLQTRIAGEEDPRRFGKALSGDKAGFWRYRVGDHRVICQIEEQRLVVLVIAIGHRRLVYQ